MTSVGSPCSGNSSSRPIPHGHPTFAPEGRVHEESFSSSSLSHAPGFTDFQNVSGGHHTNSKGSINYGSHLEERRKTMEMGAHVGIDMTKCGERVVEVVEGQGDCGVY